MMPNASTGCGRRPPAMRIHDLRVYTRQVHVVRAQHRCPRPAAAESDSSTSATAPATSTRYLPLCTVPATILAMGAFLAIASPASMPAAMESNSTSASAGCIRYILWGRWRMAYGNGYSPFAIYHLLSATQS